MQKIERFMCLTINGWEAEPSEVTYGPKEEKGPHLLCWDVICLFDSGQPYHRD